MSNQDYYLGLTEIANQIQSGETSSVAVTKQQIDRINGECKSLNAYIRLIATRALRQAEKADAEIASGNIKSRLHGVPIAVKDIFDMEGIVTTAAMPLREHATPAQQNATIIDRLENAGAVILGKLNMTEGVFAEHLAPYNAPINPWNEQLYPGASSSGSAVAAATGQCYAAISSDTGGSIRIPTAVNGVTGLKPTWGRVSRSGVFELAATLDHVGVIARTAIDVGVVLGVMAGADERDPTASQQPVPDYLADLNTDLSGTTQIVDDWFDICAVQTSFAHSESYPAKKDQYGPALANLLDHGLAMKGVDYQQVLLRREEFTGRVQRLFQDVDLIACPALAFKPPLQKRLEVIDDEMISGLHRFTCSFTMARNPTITMAGGYSSDNLPLAVQFVAPHFQEHRLIKVGYAFQTVTDWHQYHPID